jgi:hypothetical protein
MTSSTSATASPAGGIGFPPNVDADRYLWPFDEMTTYRGELVPLIEVDREFRLAACRYDPVRFAIHYMPWLLSNEDTRGVVEFNPLHLDLADVAGRHWPADDAGRRHGHRLAVVAPRGSAKSTWLLRILPMWALAFRHRRFPLIVSDSTTQARDHAGNFRRDLARTSRLLGDFPHLAPWRRGMAGARDSQGTVILTDGAVYAAQGLRERRMGLNVEGRPDELHFDDVEPDEAQYTLRDRRARERIITQAIIPMASPHAVVTISGVVTMHGSLMHDVVRVVDAARTQGREGGVAEWIASERFECRHYPPILDVDTPYARSLWPAMWSLDHLTAKRGTRTWALNFDGHPPPPGSGEHWTGELFRIVDRVPVPGTRVMCLDVALTATENSDYQAMAIASQPVGMAGTVMVELALGWQCTPTDLREKVYSALRGNPDVGHVWLEANAGGDLWADIFRDFPGPIWREATARRPRELIRGGNGDHVLHLYRATERKEARISVLLDRYRRGEIVHRGRQPEAQEQMLAWPQVEHDDIIDAIAAAVTHFPLPSMTRVS